MNTITLPVLGFAAWSGTGKTTLLVKVLPILKQKGIRVAMVKHAHHDFEIDYPGKDSYELRQAGATQMLVGSSKQWALMVEREEECQVTLRELLSHIDQNQSDIILVEGFKPEAIDKIEVHRPELGKPYLFTEDTGFIAVATDQPELIQTQLPLLDMNDPDQLVDFIIEYYGL